MRKAAVSRIGRAQVHPDLLLSGTRITESFDCQRRAVLRFATDKTTIARLLTLCRALAGSERFTAPDAGPSLVMLLGTMLHELFGHVTPVSF